MDALVEVNSNGIHQAHERVPDRWLAFGKCVRNTVYRDHDGAFSPSKTWEYFLTLKLPWKTRVYCINLDEPIVRNPRFILRFKPGWG